MSMIEGMRVEEVAEELGLSQQRVRALLADGRLEGRKIAGRWFVFPGSVERLRRRPEVRGRQLSPSNAWAFLLAASGQDLDGLSPWDRSRLLSRLDSDWDRWIPRLRDRARAVRFRIHPGSLKKISSDRRLLLSGVSAARQHGMDVIAREEIEAYLREQDLPRLVRDYKLEESSRPNLVLHVIAGDWPFQNDQKFAPPALVAVDLIESGEARSRRAGNSMLKRLQKMRPA